MKKIAITGGIASGKSELVKYIAGENFTVLSADNVNSELLKDERYIAKIAAIFPKAVKENVIDKNELKKIIGSDKSNAEKLNKIAHPLIKLRLEELMDKFCDNEIIFVEVPLLIESGMQDMFDYVVVVTACEEKRLLRAVERDKSVKEVVQGIISLQATEEERLKFADFVINNNADKANLYRQADELLKKLNIYCKGLTK